MMNGFIVLHRKLLDWEWYDDTNMVRLWLHLLFMANYEDKKWHNIEIKRGQFVTSREELSLQTGLSIRQVRTCLDRLVECGCIIKKTTNRYTMITICKYSDYQDIPEENDQQTTNKRPTDDQQTTTTKQRNKETRYNTHTICAREEELLVEAWKNETWKEAVCMNYKLTKEQLADRWEEFKKHSRASNKKHEDERDIQEHFNLWLLNRNEKVSTRLQNHVRASGSCLALEHQDYKSTFDD